jgi:cellulase/cellobiase CelA1
VDAGPDVTPPPVDTAPPVDTVQPDGPTDVALPGMVTTTLAVQTTWETGYCMNATVKNGKSVAISNWTTVINLNQSTFSQIWNGQQTLSGSQMTVKPVSWNAAIPANGTASFGFCGTKTGTNFSPTVVSTTGS